MCVMMSLVSIGDKFVLLQFCAGTSIDLMSTLLCCAVLCCAVLCCAVLCCAVLCCAVLCCALLCCAVLSCMNARLPLSLS